MSIFGGNSAKKIVGALGGKENIETVSHCMTRLRVAVKNKKRVNQQGIEAVDGVLGFVVRQEEYQIIIGMAVVDAYRKVMEELGIKSNMDTQYSDPLRFGKFVGREKIIPAHQTNAGGLKSEQIVFKSPMEGDIIPLKNLSDETFSNEVLGKGIAINPVKGKIYASSPLVVDMIADSEHAMSLICVDGPEVLIHIGIENMKWETPVFSPKVKQGDIAQTGQLLMEFDLDEIRKHGYNPVTIILITNVCDYKDITSIAESGKVKSGDKLLIIEK